MRASAFTLLVAGLFAPLALAAPTERASKTVLTPLGQRPADKAHLVPAGAKIKHDGDEVQIISKEGKVLHRSKNDKSKVGRPRTPPSSKRTEGSSSTSLDKRFGSGWVADANWYNNGDPISSFTTDWTVPEVPATNSGQTVFLFNSIEPASFDAIIQPVLQYGGSAAGGGAYWAVASWYLVGSDTFYTTPIEVSVGQPLTGVITLTGQSGSNYNYVTSFSNVDGTSLTHDNGELLVWATETLEIYGVNSAAELPAGSTTFSNINIQTTTGTPDVAWQITSDDADGVTASVVTDGATGAAIQITY